MASIYLAPNGHYMIQFVVDRRRRSVRLGAIKPKVVEMLKLRIEQIVACQNAGVPLDAELTKWISGLPDQLHKKLSSTKLIESREAEKAVGLKEFLDAFIARRTDVKPATHEVWRQPMRNLVEHFGANRDIASITEADALDFKQFLISCTRSSRAPS